MGGFFFHCVLQPLLCAYPANECLFMCNLIQIYLAAVHGTVKLLLQLEKEKEKASKHSTDDLKMNAATEREREGKKLQNIPNDTYSVFLFDI